MVGINKTLDNFLVCITENRSPTEQSQLIAEATALKRKSNDKKEKIRKLEEQIKVLKMKRKKV